MMNDMIQSMRFEPEAVPAEGGVRDQDVKLHF